MTLSICKQSPVTMKNLIIILSILFLFVICGDIYGKKGETQYVIKNVLIVAYSDIPPVSGIFSTWIQVTVKNEKEETYYFFIPHMRSNTKYPKVGTRCNMYYHYEDIDGLIGKETKKIKNAKVADEIIEISE